MNYNKCESIHDCILQDDIEADPGMIFKLNDPAEVHACLGMPSVGNLVPALQQGTRFL